MSVTTNLQNEYKEYRDIYRERYGKETTALFMQVGDFYEIYQLSAENDKYIYKIAEVCNLHVAKKNKGDVLMIGFPLIAIDKFLGILLRDGYTCIVFDQDNKITNKQKKTRQLSYIVSPGMNDLIENGDANKYFIILSILKNASFFKTSVVGLDNNTGHTYNYDFFHKDINVVLGELYKIIYGYGCVECLLYNPNDINISSLHLSNIKIHNITTLDSLEISRNYIKNVYLHNTSLSNNMVDILENINDELTIM